MAPRATRAGRQSRPPRDQRTRRWASRRRHRQTCRHGTSSSACSTSGGRRDRGGQTASRRAPRSTPPAPTAELRPAGARKTPHPIIRPRGSRAFTGTRILKSMFPISDVIPSRTTPVVTVGLILLNVLVFLYEQSLPDPMLQQFVASYALIPAWFSIPALFTSQFLHGGWMHIISNMLYLWIFGDNVEDRLGHGWFVVFYLGAGAAAAILQTLFDPFSGIPMVG